MINETQCLGFSGGIVFLIENHKLAVLKLLAMSSLIMAGKVCPVRTTAPPWGLGPLGSAEGRFKWV